MAIAVRRATADDVAAMSAVLTASIRELCTEDHRNDADLIARWTANKTIEGVGAMLAEPASLMFVAEIDGAVVAVGSIIEGSVIGLNYVSPHYRFRGVSKALLAAMEDDMRRRGVAEASLSSTATAHRFYLDAGWSDAAAPEAGRFIVDRPMKKRL